MTTFRLALGALALSLAAPVMALPTPTSYAINSAPTSTTGGATAWNNSSSSFYGTTGSLYGNSYSWSAGVGVKLTAWGSTGGAGGTTGTLQSAWIGNYDPNGLGITSRPGTGNTAELDASNNPNSGASQHAVDNSGSYESMLFTFGSAVTLNSLSIGFKDTDADATVLVYTGSGDPTAGLTTRTYQDLISNGWKVAGNLFDMSTAGPNAFSTTYSSKYWMVGAYMSSVGTNASLSNDTTADKFKISGISATAVTLVPEPEPIALIGLASLGMMLASRRRKGAKAA